MNMLADAQNKPKQIKKKCDICDAVGTWWSVNSDTVCDHCLGLGFARNTQLACIQQYSINELHKRLVLRFGEIFPTNERKPEMTAVNKPSIEEVQKELKAREGKLYNNFERVYIDSAKKLKRLSEQMEVLSKRAKDAKAAYEAERFAIDELKSKLLDLKING